ncbi:hypothetical protein BJ508DRAFT_335501 [Ascobolus immersus RN42]|uniref:Uncharacterized protein n=1 Tax=Ascobolus immersus RN42 TaxID=1160509 RepID=A0A3N4HC51_ASCIM|nr:hypothetical protein BJ508DRAFT_335501 [Ascobolus immersus RN42]
MASSAQQTHQLIRPRLSSLSTLPSFSTYPTLESPTSDSAWVLFSPSASATHDPEPADYTDTYSYPTSDERQLQPRYEEESEEDEETDIEDEVLEADQTISSSLLEPFGLPQGSVFVAPSHDGAGVFDESLTERIESWRLETARLFLSELGYSPSQHEAIISAASGKTTRQPSRAPTIYGDGGDYDGYSSSGSEATPLPWWQAVLHEILHGLDGVVRDIYHAALHIPPNSTHFESTSSLESLAAASEAVAEASTSQVSLPSQATSAARSRTVTTPVFLPTLPQEREGREGVKEKEAEVTFWEQGLGLRTIPSIFSILKRRFEGGGGREGVELGRRGRSCASGSGWGSEVGGSEGIW